MFNMKIGLDKFKYRNKYFYNSDLFLFFEFNDSLNSNKVLYLRNVIGFFDSIIVRDDCKTLRIEKPGGCYNAYLAFKLNEERIKTWPETIIFSDEKCVNLIFRCVSEDVVWDDIRNVRLPDDDLLKVSKT